MTSSQQSPVMVDASPPSHPFQVSSPDYTLSILSPTMSNRSPSAEPSTSTNTELSSTDNDQAQPAREAGVNSQDDNGRTQVRLTQAEQPASTPAAQETLEAPEAPESDESSNSESTSSTTATSETTRTISTPQSAPQENSNQIPVDSSTQLDQQLTDPVPDPGAVASDTAPAAIEDQPPAEDQPATDDHPPSSDSLETPPPPIEPEIPVPEHIPSWVQYEEDISVPDEAELKEIEADKHELNATNTNAIEKDVFTDLADPDLRPCKKIRLSWTIKGVRGTRDRPNRARIMVSPAVQVDNHFWTIKFFPRGNKSRTALSAYIRCTPTKPDDTKEDLEGSFKCYVGEPADDLSKADPILDLTLVRPEPPVADPPEPNNEADKTPIDNSASAEPPEEQTGPSPTPDQDDDDDSSMSGEEEEEEERPESPIRTEEIEDYRVSAQLGVAIYNPEEPRTVYTSSASHQFYPHHDDWGWDTAVSHWEDIHRRKRGQRQALLRNDTLVIDAYVRIIDDPTKALYWHSCKEESQWDSKGLAGVFPMGTRLLYHSPATAGIAAWSQLAPFRECLQSIDVSSWRKDSSLRPKPLISHLQLMLFQMRNMKKDELYIHIDSVIHEISRSGESFDNVFTFWDTFRRAIEIESHNDHSTISALTQIFGPRQQFRALPKLPIKGISTFADAAEKAFASTNFKGDLPDFLPLSLDRQGFDESKRQWQLHHDRVRISEELDLSRFTTKNDGHYTLYGLIVHDGDRGSSKFFSVLRPHGPGGQWLVFSDGNGNKVFSYTKKRVEQYEGLEGEELKKLTSTRQTIHTAMYVRTKCVPDYLKSEMEPFKLPSWLRPHLDEAYNHSDDIFTPDEEAIQDAPIPVEIFWDRSVNSQEGKLDLLKLKTNEKARQPEFRQKLSANPSATMAEIYAKVSSVLGLQDTAFKLWAMNYHRLGGLSKGYMYVLPRESMISSCLNTSKYLSLWFTMIPDSYELELNALVDNFLKLDGIHIEAPPKPPTPIVEESQGAEPVTEGSAESEVTNDIRQASDSNGTEASPDAEQASVSQAVQRDASTEIHSEESIPAEPHEASAIVGGEDATVTSASAVDAEQDSVANAVAGDVQRSTESAHQVIPALSGQSAPEFTPDNAEQISSLPTSTSEDAPSSNRLEATPADQAHGSDTLTDTIDSLAEPVAQSVTPQPVTPSELQNSTPTAIAQGSHGGVESGIALANVPPEVSEVLSPHDAPLSHGTAPIPVGIPIAVGQDEILLLQPAQQEDISAEDAALIQQMIAADLAAAEQERVDNEGVTNPVDTNDTGTTEQEEAVESRPSTPRQLVSTVYGFLHVFDAEGQKFTAHSTFMVARDMTISSVVRKQMGYDEDKSFHLWKREGTYRTSGVSLESTFQDASLTDCCEVIVGDHLGESKMEALKSEAKYIDPGQLMRYLAMVEREHPIASATTREDIQIAEFGSDHYRGPLVRGQRHGKKCLVITQGGDTYEGPLVAGQKSGGKGKMIYQNGDVYDGEWLDDMKHGQGEFVEKRTGNRYVGGYENDKRWGKGVTYWEQADQQAALCQVCYFEEVDALFYKCGHVVACYTCARQCATDANGCPVCRKPIEAVVKMYRS